MLVVLELTVTPGTTDELARVDGTPVDSKVAVLCAFFNNSDDARNPPSESYRDLLLDAGCSVSVHDTHVLSYPDVDISYELADVVKGADVVAILTGHDEYFGLDAGVLKELMGQTHPVIVDERNVEDADGFNGAAYDLG